MRVTDLKADEQLRITVEDGRVVIAPHGERPSTLAERLALVSPAVHGVEAMAVTLLGREVL